MMTDLRKDCPMRHENGNCAVIGGFCTAVNDPICEGLHNAYDNGYRAAALRAQHERENPSGVKTLIARQKAADVAPVRHGRWIHTDLAVHWYGKDECSECTYHEHDRSDLSHFNYCPNCGAKMDLKNKKMED